MSEEEKLIAAELFKRLKKDINSKRSTFRIWQTQADRTGPFGHVWVKGFARLSGFNTEWNFNFSLAPNDAEQFLRDCKLEVPHEESR